jgi:hypothetical protein
VKDIMFNGDVKENDQQEEEGVYHGKANKHTGVKCVGKEQAHHKR